MLYLPGNGAALVVFPGTNFFLYPDLSVPILTFLAIGAKVSRDT